MTQVLEKVKDHVWLCHSDITRYILLTYVQWDSNGDVTTLHSFFIRKHMAVWETHIEECQLWSYIYDDLREQRFHVLLSVQLVKNYNTRLSTYYPIINWNNNLRMTYHWSHHHPKMGDYSDKVKIVTTQLMKCIGIVNKKN